MLRIAGRGALPKPAHRENDAQTGNVRQVIVQRLPAKKEKNAVSRESHSFAKKTTVVACAGSLKPLAPKGNVV
jgi:hypothetical protein